MNCYITKKTAKQLKDWGCELKSNLMHSKFMGCAENKEFKLNDHFTEEYINNFNNKYSTTFKFYYAYHILEDICVKYAKEFFGEDERVVIVETCNFAHHEIEKKYIPGHTAYIIDLLQQNKKEEAEQYLLSKCIFNPKNK